MPMLRRFCSTAWAFAALLVCATAVQAENFVVPQSGSLYLQCTGGSAGATSQFGVGSSPSNFTVYLSGLPSSCPDSEVLVGPVNAGQSVEFGMSTLWGGQTFWAFSGNRDQASMVAFTDVCNNLGMNGQVIQQTSSTTWLMHLNDAAHYTLDKCQAHNILIQLRLAATGPTSTPSCSDANLSAAYTYALSGSFIDNSGKQNAFSAAGRLVADGRGNLTGMQTVSQGGMITKGVQYTGTYTVNADCTGSATLSNGAHLDFVITNNSLIDFIQTDQGTNIAGTAQKQFSPMSRERDQ